MSSYKICKKFKSFAQSVKNQKWNIPKDSIHRYKLEETIKKLRANKVELEMQNQALKEAQEGLEVSRNLYTDLYDFAPAGYLTIDNNGIIQKINLTGAKILGMEKAGPTGLPFTRFIVSADLNKFFNHLERCKKTGGQIMSEITIEKKNLGTAVLQLLTIPAVISNNITVYRSVITDLTERRKAIEEKKKLEEELYDNHKMKAIGRLAGGIAHEFNNILVSILGYTELTAEELPEGVLRENLNEVIKSCHKAKELIKQILIFSQKSAQKKEPVVISVVLRDSIALLRALLPSTIEIQQNIEGNNSIILADPAQIQQILMNLCTNSVYAMAGKCGTLEISLADIDITQETAHLYEKLRPGQYVKLTISDTGHGMNTSVMKRIFEPYFTTKKFGEGIGMGLPVVHGIVKSHKGEIKVYSEIGKGTQFHIYFPCLTRSRYENMTKETEQLTSQEGNKYILFVDDRKEIVNIGNRLIAKLGYEVIATTCSIEALEAFRNEPDKFSLVITDQTMPNMSGIALARELMKIRSDIPIILCTGYSEQVNEEQALSIGIREFIMKPFTMNNLANSIRNIMGQD
ncbi:MAG: response regulator [Candidatus Eremiobacterota bacterium]